MTAKVYLKGKEEPIELDSDLVESLDENDNFIDISPEQNEMIYIPITEIEKIVVKMNEDEEEEEEVEEETEEETDYPKPKKRKGILSGVFR